MYRLLPFFQLGLAVSAAVSLYYGHLRVVYNFAAVLLCYDFFRVTYNLFFHPLSGFPGPRGAACTRWWLAYIELVKRVSLSDLRAELHRKYGKASHFMTFQSSC